MGGTIRARVRRGLLEPLEKGQRNLAASVWNSNAHRATFTECYIGHFYGIAVTRQVDCKPKQNGQGLVFTAKLRLQPLRRLRQTSVMPLPYGCRSAIASDEATPPAHEAPQDHGWRKRGLSDSHRQGRPSKGQPPAHHRFVRAPMKPRHW